MQKIFVVERYLVGWTGEEIDELERRCDEFSSEFADRGVRYVESIVISVDETCLSVFEGPNADTVREANEVCRLPTGRVLPAVFHHPGDHAGPEKPAGGEKLW